jgi:hypothetical protein
VVVAQPAPAPVVTQAVATQAAAPAAPNCNCLTKEYTQDGNVLFKDICTNEAAAAAVQQPVAQAN